MKKQKQKTKLISSLKISCIVDETSTSIKSSRYLSDAQFLPCVKSLIDSCANSMLESEQDGKLELDQLIDKCRRLVSIAKQQRLFSANLEATNNWLATYHELTWCIQNATHDLFNQTNDDDDNDDFYEIESCLLSERERDTLVELVTSILDPLCEIYDELSNPNNVVVGFVFPAVYSLVNYELPAVAAESLEGVVSLVGRLAAELAASLRARFDFLFTSESPLHKCFLAATLLDCRFKQFQFVRDDQDRFTLLSRAKSSLAEFYTRVCCGGGSELPLKGPTRSEHNVVDGGGCKQKSTVVVTSLLRNNGGNQKRMSFVEKMLNR